MPAAGSLGFAREFNSESEQLAADRRARVAAAVNQQEWLDKEEIKWIPKKFRQNIRHERPGEEDEEEEEYIPEIPQPPEDEESGKMAQYLMGPVPEDKPVDPVAQTAKRYSYQIAVIIFGLILLGSCYFFWDNMHTHIDPHRPTLAGVQYEQVAGEGAAAGPAEAMASAAAGPEAATGLQDDSTGGTSTLLPGVLPAQPDADTGAI
mmetsp:Transcript_14400/g.30825  ORF Transcript_14400/g.30825 Transcript_14400/m.30825 type:complete len:206 (-) Transcript_14400:321-938(-)|eukprot:CAMPEP_0118922116 /NCGR_PEP_ID=MMETSP1169-20130426/1157_1 /TAXON_ID=36882 /ORGANISM="Pyramimonas obovata, Strain CCMP722" /LENGTH=205 /DNA_ID=CAMNT_0006862943 /DNA_START=105 /DNA_END=722 /DNA_ORIENTATION=+